MKVVKKIELSSSSLNNILLVPKPAFLMTIFVDKKLIKLSTSLFCIKYHDYQSQIMRQYGGNYFNRHSDMKA